MTSAAPRRSLLDSTIEEERGLAPLAAALPRRTLHEAAIEDGGLNGFAVSPQQQRASGTPNDAEMLVAARELLRAAFSEEPAFLDPFYTPAEERNLRVIEVLRAARIDHIQRSGPLARVSNDPETLLQLFRDTIGWGPAQRYFDDPRVQEVKIIGRTIQVQEQGQDWVIAPEEFATASEVERRVLNLADLTRVRLNEAQPQTTIPVAHGTRMHATVRPLVDEPLICVRRGRREAWDLSFILENAGMDAQVSALLHLLCQARCSILIAGGTGSGKTALLEALANSWPGSPHIISIEDQVSEIGIRNKRLWTRQMVNTDTDPLAYVSVAREALRQTPGLLLPGELRGAAAGPVLWLSLTGHAIITTLHADSCADALLRFASFAGEPTTPVYGGRYLDALRDTAQAFQVVIYMTKWPSLGRRVVTEIAAVAGIEQRHGMFVPVMVPLCEVVVQEDGSVTWDMKVRITPTKRLEPLDSTTKLPDKLLRKLQEAQAAHAMAARSTTLDDVQQAAERAERYLSSSEPHRALATVQIAWDKRHDNRLLMLAQKAVEQSPTQFRALLDEAQVLMTSLQIAINQHSWPEARKLSTELLRDVGKAAAVAPQQGWDELNHEIGVGIMGEQNAATAIADAEQLLTARQSRRALEALRDIDIEVLPQELALNVLRHRESAMEQLVATGEGSRDMLIAVRARREAVEQRRVA